MQDLKITLIQTELAWEDIDANLAMFSKKLRGIFEETHLVVLPEMFNTGFTMSTEKCHEEMNGKTMKWMADISKELGVTVTGSLIIKEEDKYFNRLIWMRPDGSFAQYDKRHMFRLGDEQLHYTPGKQRLMVELKGWKICPQVCYDLRFPIWNRNVENYDLLLLVANWPERRVHAWKSLLLARAIENECYVVGVNRVGNDGNGIYHSGASSTIDYEGKIIWQAEGTEEIKTASINKERLDGWREKFPFWKDADRFTINAD